MPITADVQTLEPGALVALYEVDISFLGGEILRFHGYGVGSIFFQGFEYEPWPIKAEGFEMSGDGKQSAPSMTLANLENYISSLVIYFDDLVGAKVTRRQTLAKYLDGQPTADPNEELPPSIWYVERKMVEVPGEYVQFELASALDFQGQMLPRRQILANSCSWLTIGGYRGPYCGYNGPPVADEFDIITTDATKDKCGGLVRSCKLRFGENNELPYGSYAAAGLIR
ncbi:minor tail protein L [Pseudomonas phage ZQG1]|nr:minor tail protein L [Pseudomonas phage ZQG1]